VQIWYSSPSRATISGFGNTTFTVGSFTVHRFPGFGAITFTS
jgi:hypothetical protein